MYVLNNTTAALDIVNEGLSKYPSDKKLNALKKKLEDKKDKKDQDKKDQNKKNQDKKGQNKKDKDKKDDKGKEKEDDKDKEKPNDKKPKENENPKDGGKPKPLPGGISQQRLENLLDAVNNEEKKIQEKVNAKKVKGKPVQTEKDW
jgi:hypothetical protein